MTGVHLRSPAVSVYPCHDSQASASLAKNITWIPGPWGGSDRDLQLGVRESLFNTADASKNDLENLTFGCRNWDVL
jgi:hypothetical protein